MDIIVVIAFVTMILNDTMYGKHLKQRNSIFIYIYIMIKIKYNNAHEHMKHKKYVRYIFIERVQIGMNIYYACFLAVVKIKT